MNICSKTSNTDRKNKTLQKIDDTKQSNGQPFFFKLKHQHAPLQKVILHAILSYISVVIVRLKLFVRTIYLFKVHRDYIRVSHELFDTSID